MRKCKNFELRNSFRILYFVLGNFKKNLLKKKKAKKKNFNQNSKKIKRNAKKLVAIFMKLIMLKIVQENENKKIL